MRYGKRSMKGFTLVGLATVMLSLPAAATASHLVGVSLTLDSVNTATRTVDLHFTISTVGPSTTYLGGALFWGDASTEVFGTPDSTTGTGPFVYRRAFTHVYPDILPRTIVAVDCCTSTSASTTLSDSLFIAFGCTAAPMGACRTAEAAQIDIKSNADDAKDQLKWKWKKGAATTLEALGAPLAGTEYYFCVYAPTLVVDAVIPSSSTLWKATGTKGFKYKDKTGAAGGVTGAKLKIGEAGKALAQIKAKGTALDDPAMPLTQPVTAQLQNSAGECWGHAYTAPEKFNTAERFLDKEP